MEYLVYVHLFILNNFRLYIMCFFTRLEGIVQSTIGGLMSLITLPSSSHLCFGVFFFVGLRGKPMGYSLCLVRTLRLHIMVVLITYISNSILYVNSGSSSSNSSSSKELISFNMVIQDLMGKLLTIYIYHVSKNNTSVSKNFRPLIFENLNERF
ncbi:hypothetical protein U3516DRAFT_774291 [Neocallimastix sp. 'constans']